jgi:hypothetical protein
VTLILTFASQNLVVQASDRLLTLLDGGKEHDRLACKTVVWRAADEVVVLGYTGVAYLDGIPTDTWVARKLCPDIQEQQFALRFGQEIAAKPLHQGLRDLIAELQRTFFAPGFPRESRSVPWRIYVAGYQSLSKTAKPVAALLASQPNGTCHMKWDGGNWRWPNKFRLAPIPQVLSGEERRSLVARLEKPSSTATSAAEHVEQVLVEEIKNQAGKHRTIGRDVTTVTLGLDGVKVRYHGETVRRATFDEGTPASFEAESAYSPWLIGRYGFLAPCRMTHTQSGDLGGLPYEIIGPAASMPAALSSVRRPPPPRG